MRFPRSLPPGRNAVLSLELRILAIERRRLADHLHDVGAHRAREVVRGVLHVDVGVLRELDLHQLVRAQRIVDRLRERVGEPVLSDVDGRR